MRRLFIAALLISYAAVMGSRARRLGRLMRAVRRDTAAYTRPVKGARQHILVLGDSTMYGAGVKDRQHTISGLLAQKYPAASIETLAAIDARVADLPAQLAQAGHRHYRLIMVGIGGNDVIKFSDFSRLRHQLETFFDAASRRSDRVIICNSVNLGNIGFFLFPFNRLFDARSRRYGQLCEQVAATFPKVRFVNLYRPIGDDHYDQTTRHRFIADDDFHANDYANRYFFDLIWRQAGPDG